MVYTIFECFTFVPHVIVLGQGIPSDDNESRYLTAYDLYYGKDMLNSQSSCNLKVLSTTSVAGRKIHADCVQKCL